jgi:hypothetical protein
MNLEDIYGKLPQDQRKGLAQEFLNGLGESKENIDPNTASPQQLANLHREAQQRNPGLLQKIRNHPLLAGVIGGIATYEVDKHFGKG